MGKLKWRRKLVRPQKERAGKLESNMQNQPRLKMRRTIQNCCTNVSIRVTSVPSLMPLTSGKMAKLVALKPQPRTITFRDTNSAIYALMYDAFSVVDGGGAEITKDDDRRISLAELKAACSKFEGHPLVGAAQLGMPKKYGNVESVFMEMDSDGKGMVLLNEWCAWLEAKEAANNTKLGKLLKYSKDGDD